MMPNDTTEWAKPIVTKAIEDVFNEKPQSVHIGQLTVHVMGAHHENRVKATFTLKDGSHELLLNANTDGTYKMLRLDSRIV
ncbi:MAG: hypothetical protein GY861_01395 [bacterium]|nr:hypothetical protein [bacterium]